MLACEPGAQAAAALPGTRKEVNFAVHGSSVTASEIPMFTPAMAIRPVNTVTHYTQFVGKLKNIKSPLSGNASNNRWGLIEGSDAYKQRDIQLDAQYGNLRVERIDAWTEEEWKEVAQMNFNPSVEVLEQINTYEEGTGGKRLCAYLVQVAILPNETGKPEVHVAIETHHCTRSILNETDEGELLVQQYALSLAYQSISRITTIPVTQLDAKDS